MSCQQDENGTMRARKFRSYSGFEEYAGTYWMLVFVGAVLRGRIVARSRVIDWRYAV